jgi:sterol 14-demethylase
VQFLFLYCEDGTIFEYHTDQETYDPFFLFCSHKQFMPPVIEGQKEIMRRHGSHLDYDVLYEMNALHRSMKEALRLHPPPIMLLRYNHSDFSVTTKEGHNYTIPKGHIVATSPAFANRLPYIYKDPDTFNPDRFAPGNEEDVKGGQFSYTSFGGGRHGCLGETFAYMQVST